MNMAFVAFIWGCLQIGIVCIVPLGVAYLLRGRRPQLVTAMLAGTCIASLLLAIVSLVPTLQWTMVDSRTEQSPPSQADTTARSQRSSDSNQPVDTLADSTSDMVPTSIDQRVANQSHTIQAIRQLVSNALVRVDQEVRQAEGWSRPNAAARNYSWTLFIAFGLVTMTLIWISSWLYVRRILIASRRIDDEDICKLVTFHAKAFGLKALPDVRESRHVPIGATVGWRRVTILLHSNWRDWNDDEKSAVIAHEIAHASRHDFLWVVVASWTRILLFFHPMVHLVIQRLRMEQELAADQLAAGKLRNARAYGRALASLVLRSQASLEASNPKLGSMLAAGPFCVTRRIMMLKQGSLRPAQSRSRWSLVIVFAFAMFAIPAAGLRGITQEPIAEPSSSEPSDEVVQKSDSAAAPKPLSKEFLAAYPPVEFKGAMVYRPGRFRAGEFGPVAAWLQDWFSSTILGQPMPDTATVYGESSIRVGWGDEQREHGQVFSIFSVRQGDSTIPGQLTKLIDFPQLRSKKARSVATKQVGGRTVTGITYSSSSDEPQKWFVDDEQGFVLGSLEDVEQYIHGQSVVLASVPEQFRDDYRSAAFAMVFNDCGQWKDRLESFSKGSPKDAQFLPAVELLEGVKQIGLFVDGCNSPACSLRVITSDAAAAQNLAGQVKALIEVGKLTFMASIATDGSANVEADLARSLLETIQLDVKDAEVIARFDIFVPSLDDGSAINASNGIPGWQSFDFSENPKVHSSDTSFVQFGPGDGNQAMPCLFSQTVDASDYQAKTITVEVDMQCNEQALDKAGVFAWASRSSAMKSDLYGDRQPIRRGSPYVGHRTLAATTNACDGNATFRSAMEFGHDPVVFTKFTDTWRTVAVDLDVPIDAEHISFGCYTKNAIVHVRNVRFRVNESTEKGAKQASRGKDALADMPFNMLITPGYEIRKEPINLSFDSVPAAPLQQASQAEPAVR